MVKEADWYAEIGDEQAGPFSKAEVGSKVRQGAIASDTLVWREGMGDWLPLAQVPELSNLIAEPPSLPSRRPSSRRAAAREAPTKDKTTAGILGLLLGEFGAHHFYLGANGAGVVCIAVFFLTCGIGYILPIIEGIMLLTMNQADFDDKYNARRPESMEFVFTKPRA